MPEPSERTVPAKLCDKPKRRTKVKRAASRLLFLLFLLVQEGSTQIARTTLLERRQREQTLMWQGVPLTIAFTRRTLGFQVLLDRLWEWETFIPKVTPLPQISHLAIVAPPSAIEHNKDILPDIPKKCKWFGEFIFENCKISWKNCPAGRVRLVFFPH